MWCCSFSLCSAQMLVMMSSYKFLVYAIVLLLNKKLRQFLKKVLQNKVE